jgi:hypothetical protein
VIFKKVIAVLLFTALLSTGCKSWDDDVIGIDGLIDNHVGTWKGSSEAGVNLQMTLDSQGFAVIRKNDKKINPGDTNPYRVVYAIDYTSDPVACDIIFMYRNRESIVYSLIVEFITPEVMRVATNFSQSRLRSFEDAETIEIFLLNKR